MHPKDATDADLILLIAQGDRPAFDTLVERYYTPMLRYARAYRNSGVAAEDAMQETFLAIWRHAHTFKSGKARAWMYTIARNATRTQHREEPAHTPSLEELGADAGWGVPAATQRIDSAIANRDEMDKAFASLEEDDRVALMLVDVDGLSVEDAAEACEVSPGAMKVRRHRARLRLSAALRAGAEIGSSLPAELTVGGLRCTEVLAVLSDFFDGLLEPATRTAVEQHVAGCDICARFGGTFSRAIVAMRSNLRREPNADDTARHIAKLKATAI